MTRMDHPHARQPVDMAGAPLEQATKAVILLHGRGGEGQDILQLAPLVGSPAAGAPIAFLAPNAAGRTWYPERFTAPLEQNEPWLSSALQMLDELIARLTATGIGPEQTVLAGFSQGACLALEYAARRPRRYAGVAGFSGGLIGPEDAVRAHAGSLAGTPVFLGCSDVDPHIPIERVTLTAEVFRAMAADVTLEIYPELGHKINDDEISAMYDMLA